MKPLTEKMLKSGLVDKHFAAYLERVALLPEGASEMVRDDVLKNATKDQLTELAEDLAEEVEKHKAKETALDLRSVKWPVMVRIVKPTPDGGEAVATLQGLRDRLNRFFFRFEDASEQWFVPGYIMTVVPAVAGKDEVSSIIVEHTILSVGDDPVCFQVALA